MSNYQLNLKTLTELLNSYFNHFQCLNPRIVNFKIQTQNRSDQILNLINPIQNSETNFQRIQIQIQKLTLIQKKFQANQSWQNSLRDLEIINQILDQIEQLPHKKPQINH